MKAQPIDAVELTVVEKEETLQVAFFNENEEFKSDESEDEDFFIYNLLLFLFSFF